PEPAPPPPVPAAGPPAAAPAAPADEPADPIIEVARSRAARRGLGTKRALYHRIARTRQLLRLWSDLGKYLASPRRRLRRSSEATDLIRKLSQVQESLEDFPRLLGEAGQPGYLVLALAKLVIVPTFQTLTDSQREALS